MIKTNKQINIQLLAFASQLIPAIIGVVSFMILVRTAKPIVLGQYIIYIAAVGLFEMVKSCGLQSALVMRVSGSNQDQQLTITGSAYWLGAVMSFSLSAILCIFYFSGIFAQQPGIQVFCGWYAILGIITLPLHLAEASAVAKQDLKFILLLRFLQSTSALIVALYAYFKGGQLETFATINLLFTGGLMLLVLIAGKTNPLQIRFKTMQEVKALFNLIKYTLATLATTNFLKSADTFLIGSLMGPINVAKYAIPLKLTELFEIPLRSLSTTAFPQLATKYNNNDMPGFKKAFIQYFSWAYMLYIPTLIIAFILAPYIVLIIGGHQYAETTSIFRVFILYALLLPTDRLTGISLDALQLPSENFKKVFIMAFVNILADILAIQFTHQLEWVAFASVLNAATGAFLGWWMLKNKGILQTGKIWNEVNAYSFSFLKNGIQHLKSSLKH